MKFRVEKSFEEIPFGTICFSFREKKRPLVASLALAFDFGLSTFVVRMIQCCHLCFRSHSRCVLFFNHQRERTAPLDEVPQVDELSTAFSSLIANATNRLTKSNQACRCGLRPWCYHRSVLILLVVCM